MIEITDTNKFGKVISDAIVAIDTNNSLASWEKLRWTNAVANAVALIEDRGEFIEYFAETGEAVIWSDSNEVYTANGTCQCEAYKRGYPCKHRAIAKLLKNYFAEIEKETIPETLRGPETLPYLKQPTGQKPMQVGNLRI